MIFSTQILWNIKKTIFKISPLSHRKKCINLQSYFNVTLYWFFIWISIIFAGCRLGRSGIPMVRTRHRLIQMRLETSLRPFHQSPTTTRLHPSGHPSRRSLPHQHHRAAPLQQLLGWASPPSHWTHSQPPLRLLTHNTRTCPTFATADHP